MHSRAAYVSFILAGINVGAALAESGNYGPGPEMTDAQETTTAIATGISLGTAASSGGSSYLAFDSLTTLSEIAIPTDMPSALPPMGTGSGPATTDNCGWLSAAGYTITCAGSPAGPTGEARPSGYSRPGDYTPHNLRRRKGSYGGEPKAIVASPAPSGSDGGQGRAMCYQLVLGYVDEAGTHSAQQIPCYIVGGIAQSTWHHSGSGNWPQPSEYPDPSGTEIETPPANTPTNY